MINRTKRSRLRSVEYHMDGMMSSNILGMITSLRKSPNPKLAPPSRSSSRNQKIRTGGAPSAMNST